MKLSYRLHDEQREHLVSQGITDPAIPNRYRICSATDDLQSYFGLAGKFRVQATSICWPTFDPRHPTSPVGLLSIPPTQYKHRFITEPIGIGCTKDLRSCQRWVLVTSPLMALHLAQEGVEGVALVADPAVMKPLHDLLEGREVVVASTKIGMIKPIMRAMGDAGKNAQALILKTNVMRSSASALETLGIETDADHGKRLVFEIPEHEPIEDAPVEEPSSQPTIPVPIFIEEDHTAEVAIYESGTIRYAVELCDDGETNRLVVMRANGFSCQDRFDLASEPQCARFAGNASRRVKVAADVIPQHLAAIIEDLLHREDQHTRQPAVHISDGDRVLGESLLDDPALIDRVSQDLHALGWVGEERTRSLLYLTAVSRLLPQPVWSVYRASGAAHPWQALGLIAALTPPEDRVVYHRLTDAQITQADRHALRQKLLMVDQAEMLRPEAALALRVLRERAGIGWATALGGGTGEVAGPVAVLAAAAGDIDHRCRDCFMALAADESQEQTEAILAATRRRMNGPGPDAAEQARIIATHHAAQRLLERLPVVIPFVDRVVFPSTRVRHREELSWFLSLVAASALLHQRQREQDDGAIIASEDDFHLVRRLSEGYLGTSEVGIGHASQRLLQAIFAAGLATFTMADLSSLFPDWTRYAFRAALQDLMDFGHIEAPQSKRGRSRRFTLVARDGAHAPQPTVFLRPVGELAKVGETRIANLSIKMATG